MLHYSSFLSLTLLVCLLQHNREYISPIFVSLIQRSLILLFPIRYQSIHELSYLQWLFVIILHSPYSFPIVIGCLCIAAFLNFYSHSFLLPYHWLSQPLFPLLISTNLLGRIVFGFCYYSLLTQFILFCLLLILCSLLVPQGNLGQKNLGFVLFLDAIIHQFVRTRVLSDLCS